MKNVSRLGLPTQIKHGLTNLNCKMKTRRAISAYVHTGLQPVRECPDQARQGDIKNKTPYCALPLEDLEVEEEGDI